MEIKRREDDGGKKLCANECILNSIDYDVYMNDDDDVPLDIF